MKKLIVFFVLACAIHVTSAQGVQKQRYAQPVSASYPLTLHVTHSFVSLNGGASYLHLVGVLGDANVELVTGPGSASYFTTGVLHPGNYPARLIGEDAKKDGSTISQYDLQLANGQHEVFTLIGLSE